MKFVSTIFVLAMSTTVVAATDDLNFLRGLKGPKMGKSCAAIDNEYDCINSPPEGLECCWKEFENEGPPQSKRKPCGELGDKDCPVERRELKKGNGPKAEKPGNGRKEGKSCAFYQTEDACTVDSVDAGLDCCWKTEVSENGNPCGEASEPECPADRRELKNGKGPKSGKGPKLGKSCAAYDNKEDCINDTSESGLECCWKTGSNGIPCGEVGEPLDSDETCDTE